MTIPVMTSEKPPIPMDKNEDTPMPARARRVCMAVFRTPNVKSHSKVFLYIFTFLNIFPCIAVLAYSGYGVAYPTEIVRIMAPSEDLPSTKDVDMLQMFSAVVFVLSGFHFTMLTLPFVAESKNSHSILGIFVAYMYLLLSFLLVGYFLYLIQGPEELFPPYSLGHCLIFLGLVISSRLRWKEMTSGIHHAILVEEA